MKKVIVALVVIFGIPSSFATNLIQYSDNANEAPNVNTLHVSEINIGVGFTAGVVGLAPLKLDNFKTGIFPVTNSDPYFQWGVINIKESIEVTNVSMKLLPNLDGPREVLIEIFALTSSTTGFVAHSSTNFLQQAVTNNISINIASAPAVSFGILVRVHGAKADTSSGTLELDDGVTGLGGVALSMDGNIIPIPPSLTLSLITPLTGEISGNENFQLPFTEAITTEQNFASIECLSAGTINYASSVTGASININPNGDLPKDDICELFIDPDKVEDLRGYNVDNITATEVLRTYVTPNQNSPSIDLATTFPSEGQMNVPPESNLVVRFTEPVFTNENYEADEGDNFANLLCNGSQQSFLYSMLKYSNFGTELTLDPDQTLPSGSSCQLSLFSLSDFHSNALVGLTTISFSTTPLSGDVNLDGTVNLGDAILLERAILGLEALSTIQKNAADLAPESGDNLVKLNDLNALRRMLLNI